MKTPLLYPALAATLVLLVAAPPSARAVRVTAQATAICQGALPAFETRIRKRPLAVQNEGTASAYVSCAFNNAGNSGGTSAIASASLYLVNSNSGSRSVDCTGVNAWSDGAESPLYATRRVQVPAGGAGAVLEFTVDDFPGESFVLPGDTFSVSCNLGPGLGIAGTVLVNNA